MLVTTVIAAYNAAATLSETLDSALAQDWADHEIIVVNDGSTDSTLSILGQYRRRIRVLNQSNRGAAAARNAGTAAANGKYVAFLDSDDLWVPHKLSTVVPRLEQNARATLAFSEYAQFGPGGIEYPGSRIGHAPTMREMMGWLPPILTSTWVLPKTEFQRCGGFSCAFGRGQGFEDSWLLLLLRENGEFTYVPEELTRYRVADNGESADKYGHALSAFIELATERYGAAGAMLARSAINLQCRWMLSKAARQIDRGDRAGALRTLIRIALLRPAFFAHAEIFSRVFLRRNMRRIRSVIRPD